MAAIGSAVGLGNLWRFPAQAFQNGGGAFFIPYFIALISAGFPLMIVEYAIGQKYQGGAPQALAAVTRKFRWVGWFALLVGSVIVVYYVVVMAYAWHYCAGSFSVAWARPTSHLEWEAKSFGAIQLARTPAANVKPCLVAEDVEDYERFLEAQSAVLEASRLPVFIGQSLQQRRAEEKGAPPSKRMWFVVIPDDQVEGLPLGLVRAGQFRVCALAPDEGARQRLTDIQLGKAEADRIPVFTRQGLEERRQSENAKPVAERTFFVADDQSVQISAMVIPAERMKLCLVAPDEQALPRLKSLQEGKPADERLPVFTRTEFEERVAEEECKPKGERTHYLTLDANVGKYFSEKVLGGFHAGLWAQQETVRTLHRLAETPGTPEAAAQAMRETADEIEDALQPQRDRIFKLSPNLVIGAAITWLLIFLIIFKGVRNVGRVVMLTVPLPVILILVMIVRGVTLPGAGTGLLYYLRPNWEMLTDPSVWIHAYGQIFFSLSLGFGILIAYASYMPEESDVANSALITCFGNCVTSFLAGLAVFSVLGYLAYLQNAAVKDVVAGGPGLVFVTYPVALAEMPMAKWGVATLSLLFFVCLVTLGIDSAFSLVEGILTGFGDRFRSISRPVLTGILCAIGLCGSLFICTRSGLMWLDIMDNWMSNYGLALVGLLECIAVGYFFHLDELKDYINRHSEVKVHYWFDAFIKFVTPAILIVLLGRQFLGDISAVYGGYDKILRHAVTGAGWGVFLTIFVLSLWLGRNWRALIWTAAGAITCVVAFFYFRLAVPSAEPSDLIAPAVMASVGVVLLFGGLLTGIYIAVKTHHMAGISLEAVHPPEGEAPSPSSEASEGESRGEE